MRAAAVLLTVVSLASLAPAKVTFVVKQVPTQNRQVTVLQPLFPMYLQIDGPGLVKGETLVCTAHKNSDKEKSEGKDYDLDCGHKGRFKVRNVILEPSQ